MYDYVRWSSSFFYELIEAASRKAITVRRKELCREFLRIVIRHIFRDRRPRNMITFITILGVF